ncbi:AMP-binding protein [bacterium]|nr:AMP-binding protein [bacterium]
MQTLQPETLKEMLDHSITNFPDNIALAFVDGQSLTYSALDHKIENLIILLRKCGITKGDKIGLLGENMPHWGVTYMAVTAIGAVIVPILPDFHANEIHHILRHSGCKAVVVSEKFVDKVIDADLPGCKTLIQLDDLRQIMPQNRIGKFMDLLRDGEREVNKLKESAKRLAGILPIPVCADDLAAIIYTSGTTGHAKGVMLSHKNIISDVYFTLKIQNMNECDRLLSILPLSHTYENTLGFMLPLSQGAAVYYLEKPPVPSVLLPALAKIKPTMMLTVPLIIEKIYKTKVLPKLEAQGIIGKLTKIGPIRRQLIKLIGKKLMQVFGGELRFFGIGGSSVSPEVEIFLREAKFPYAIGYGLTETAPLIAGSSPALTRAQSTGFPLPDVDIRISDPDPLTGEGEIQIKGDNVMLGYYKDDLHTAEVMTDDGYFKTGDLGNFDKDGYLFIKGRLKNVIIGANGENIYPEEIESHLNRQDLVLESLVFSIDGHISARVFPDYEHLDRIFKKENLSQTEMADRIQEILESIRKSTNTNIASNARIHRIIEQKEPFTKTPTHKIKRFLYTSDDTGKQKS